MARVAPVYVFIALGYVAGRWLRPDRDTLSRLLLYFFGPSIIFHSLAREPVAASSLAATAAFFAISCGLALLFLAIGGRVFSDPRKFLVGFSAGDANAGYFALPVAAAVFGPDSLGRIVLMTFAFILFEATLGFYLAARGRHRPREALVRVLRFPAFYAFALGLLCGTTGNLVPAGLNDAFAALRGTYSVLGMMIVGLGLSAARLRDFNPSFIGLALAAKFVAWPAAVALLIGADRAFLHLFDAEMHRYMAFMSVLPMAANTVVIASEFHISPNQAAAAVFVSTLLGSLLIPLVLAGMA